MKTALCFVLLMTSLGWADPEPQCKVEGGEETYVGISADGTRAYLDRSSSLSVFDVENMRLMRELRGLERLTCATFSPKGNLLAVGDYPRWLASFDCQGRDVKKLWEYKAPWSGQGIRQMAGGPDVVWSPDCRFLLTVDGSHGAQEGWTDVNLMDARQGRVVKTFSGWGGRRGGRADDFGFTADSRFFLRAAHDKLQMYSVPEGNKVKEVRLPGLWGGKVEVYPTCVDVHHNGAGGVGYRTSRFSLPDFKPLGERKSDEQFPEHPDGTFRFRSEGGDLVVTRHDEEVFRGQGQVVRWIPQGGFILSRPGQEQNTLYDAAGKVVGPLSSYTHYGGNFADTVAGYGGPCALYDLLNGTVLGKLTFASSVAYSQNGRRAAIAMRKGILVVDLAASRQKGKLVPVGSP